MNKILITSLIASGLLLLDSPDAAAHDESGGHQRWSDKHYARSYDRDDNYRRGGRRHFFANKYRRSGMMPRWLKRDRSFKRWYRYSEYRLNRRISWHRLFDIYNYEYRYYRYRRH